MHRLLGCFSVLAICMLPGVASSECVVWIYHVSGKVVDAKGKPLSTTIRFSWAEEHDGRPKQMTGKTSKGKYQVAIPFYAQSKSAPGSFYDCNAKLTTLHYTFASAPGKQESGDIVLSGDYTTADLPAGVIATPLHK